jgi:CRP-like cAMP-binding protein
MVQRRSNGHLQNRLLAALPPKAFSLVESSLRASTFKQAAIVQEAGEPVDQIYFPQTGMISLLVVTQIGKTTLIHASRHPDTWHDFSYLC